MVIPIALPILDESMGGGIPPGKSLLYCIQPGVEGDVFGMQTLYYGLENGYKAVYISTSSSPDYVRERFREFGWELESYEGQLDFVDAYSHFVGLDSNEKYVVDDPDDINNIDSVVIDATKNTSNSIIMCESLSSIMDMCGEIETIAKVNEWTRLSMLYDNTSIYNFTAWHYSDETIKKIRSEVFNSVIRVGGIGERVIFGQYFGVMKADWCEPSRKTFLFRIVRPGGVRVYIPKILVTGPFDAGKTTFVHALSTRAVSVDRFGTTVALDHGHIDHKGLSADIFGTPGQERFDPILKLLGGESMGVFLVVDSMRSNTFARAKDMLKLTKTFGLPCIVIANKQDVPGAAPPERIKIEMALPDDIPVVPVSSKEKTGVVEAFEMLVDNIMRGL